MGKLTAPLKPRSSTQIVARQHMKNHLRRIRNREYCKLRDMVPAIANKQKVTKVAVIEEAVRYIDELHRALASRLGTPDIQRNADDEEVVKDFVHSFLPADFYQRKPAPVDYEKHQKLPTFMRQDRTKIPRKFAS